MAREGKVTEVIKGADGSLVIFIQKQTSAGTGQVILKVSKDKKVSISTYQDSL